MTDHASFMAEHGARLVDNGYAVIPIMPGAKVPGRFSAGEWTPYPDWTRHADRSTKPFEIDIWRRWPGCGVGIACGAVVGLDIDVMDAALAIQLTDLATEMLGDTPCMRIGQAPKRLLVYRADTSFAGRKRHPLEVLARGQQFVAHAIHPGTGRPYTWPQDSLLDVPLASLPVVTEAQALDWLDRAYGLIPAELKPRTLMGDSAPAGTWKGPSDPRGTFAAVQAALQYIPNEDLDGASWITMGAAIKAALGEEGRQLWLDWSRQSSKSGASGRGDTPERRWASLRPHSIGAGSIYATAIERGWVPPPEITLNADVADRAAQPHPAAALLAKAATTTLPAVIAPPPAYRVPPDLLEVDGALRMFVDYATSTAVSPQPFLALGAGLCLLGAVAGRRYRTPTDLRSNLYAIGIADSGGGKDHARRCAKRVLYAAGLDRYLGGEDLASSAGLLASLQMHPSRLFQVDEFGQFLKLVLAPRAPFHKAAIWTELTKLYTSASEAYIGAEYTTGGISDWDALMQGVFQHLPAILTEDGQALVNLGLIHRDGEWQPYWQGWVEWMRAQGWRRFGLYAWDQGPGLPGDWNGRLAPAFELVFHFNRKSRQPNKIIACKWAGTENKGSGLRAADGEVKAYTHAGLPVQEMRIPDSVLRITRHKGRGIETEHPAVFPVALPELLLQSYANLGDAVFEPFAGSGTTILAGQRTGRRVRAIELAPAYVDLAIARYRMVFPKLQVTLDDDGRDYDAVAAARSEAMADAV